MGEDELKKYQQGFYLPKKFFRNKGFFKFILSNLKDYPKNIIEKIIKLGGIIQFPDDIFYYDNGECEFKIDSSISLLGKNLELLFLEIISNFKKNLT